MNFKWNACKKWTSLLKLVVILAQCRYTRIAQKYLNTVIYNTPVWLRIKNWTVWYIERYSVSMCKGVTTNFWKKVLFGPPCRDIVYRFWLQKRSKLKISHNSPYDSWPVCFLVWDSATFRGRGSLAPSPCPCELDRISPRRIRRWWLKCN